MGTARKALLHALAAALAVLHATPASASEEAPRWSFGVEGSYYYLPDDTDHILWSATADRDLLHLEARYNYEDLRTISTFVGLNFGFHDRLQLELTPMVGAVLGRTRGLAPGLELDLSFWKLELYSEAEYVFDLGEPEASFFYSWTELFLWPVEWGRVGLVFERTRIVGTRFDLNRGFLVGLAYRHFSATVLVLNPGADGAYAIFRLAAEW